MYHDIQNFKYSFQFQKKTFNKKWLLFPVENDEKDRKSAISNINFNRYVEYNVNSECQLSTQTHSDTANHAVNIIIAQ